MSKAWYFFMGDDPLDAKNYYHVNAHNCLCGNRICSIYLYYTGRQPTAPLSANMQQYINNALATGQLQPAKPYYAKKYVYLREI